MNPQFFSPLQVRPKLVPVVVQPTVPLASTSYALPPVNTFTSPVQHNNAFSTFCMSAADVVLDGKTTTARTRRELEHLGSTRRATELIFELAARKNGIRVGVDSSSRAASAGKLQDDSLEDFKKIAQQNGITVCPPGSISVEENGSKVRKDSDNACSQITENNPTDNLANKHGEGMCLPTSHSIYPWESDSPSSAANFYELNNNHNDFKCSEEKGEIANEVPFEFRTTNTLDLFKIKAAASGIKVQHVTTMIEGQKPEFTQWGKQFSHHSETVLGMADLDTCVSGDTNSATSNVERVNDTESDATIMHYVNQNDEGYEDTRPEQEIFSEDSEKKSSIQKCGKEVPLSELRKEMDAANTCSEEGTDSDGRTNNSKEDQLDNEHVLSSSKEDAEIAAFQKIARQKGIKVGNSLPTTRLSTISCEVNAVESIEAHGSDVLEFTGDAQIAKFHEMARLNGIRVGGKMQESPLHSDGLKSFTTVSTKGNECWPRTPHPFGELCQIISVQDIGRVRDFKVTGEFSGSSSCSSLSTASSEDHLYYAGREGWRTTDRYEEVAKRNGIKIGKNCEASAQTEVHVETTDYCSQTCEEDLGFFKRNTGVQVDAVREAFEREFKQWKLDDNAAGDSEELCYKKLYLTERNAHEAIKDSLQNEKDVSANTKHNHKRVMEELKEELKSQGEEIEKLKKDLKTVKRQKETEAKRIVKDLKSKEDELESTKGALQLKEVALEGLRSIIKDKSEKLKTAEEQLEEMKTVLSKMRENRECSTCKPGSHSSQRDDLEDRSNDGWKLHTMRKSRSTLFKTAYGKKGGGSPFPDGADELCVIDKVSLPSSFRQRNGNGTRHLGGELTVQALNYAECGMTSPENGETAAPTEEESMIQEVIQTPSSQDSSNTIIQNVESSTTQLQNNSFSSHVSPKASIGNEGYATKQLVEGEDQRAGQNSSLSNGDNSILPINTAVPNFTGQHQPLQPFLPIQPLPFPALPTHIIAQYLAGLVVQPSIPKENNFPDGCKPPRPPPGLNTEPLPAEEQEYPSPPPRPAGKFSSFEKLMERLHKRFPDKSRQELIGYLRKVKAASGVGGFRGKPIAYVIKCVEEVIEEKQDL